MFTRKHLKFGHVTARMTEIKNSINLFQCEKLKLEWVFDLYNHNQDKVTSTIYNNYNIYIYNTLCVFVPISIKRSVVYT